MVTIHKDYEIKTPSYQESNNNATYLQWQLFFSNNMDTKDAADISFKSLQSVLKWPTLKNDVKKLKKVFREIDGYPN